MQQVAGICFNSSWHEHIPSRMAALRSCAQQSTTAPSAITTGQPPGLTFVHATMAQNADSLLL
jgi:hypothetical protein